MKYISLLSALAVAAFISCSGSIKSPSGNIETKQILADASRQYKHMATMMTGRNSFPKTYNRYLERMQTSNSEWWCSGFYPGTLFYLYEESGEQKLWDEGVRMLGLLEQEQYNTTTHDIGFMIYCSYGNAHRIDPKPEYEQVIINAANSLASRFNPIVGCIKSHNRGEDEYPVIIDNMMNLELLFEATRMTGDSLYWNIAVTHANTTLKNHFRPDGSVYHAIEYNPSTGEIRDYVGGQGYAKESLWSRGQAWGLYGYAMAYRYTQDPHYLEASRKLAELTYTHPHMPADRVPYWDYDAPTIPDALRDASAAAINAAGLLELARYVDEPSAGKYRQWATETLLTLSSPEYTAAPGTNGGFILIHGAGNLPAMTEVDVPLTYGDYYYVEALKRYQADTLK